MSQVDVSCPGCGAQISFKTGSSIVTVCEFCKSVVARGDRNIEDLGKVADLVDTGSPLDVGLKGVYHGTPFELTGRAQLGHEAGGIWDEWYAAFSDGRWGWLAEAQGRFYMTFQQSLPPEISIPPVEDLGLGQAVEVMPGSVPLTVAEKAEARALSAEGEIPYKLVPGQAYYYADLSGPHGEFATLDYGESPPNVFVGREIRLADLGFPESAVAPEREARHVSGVQLSCPQCGGPLDLRAPDQTQRVTCPNCGSLLDVNQGRLEFLTALGPGKVKPAIPIGSIGEFYGVKFMLIGFMQRSVVYEGTRYYWEEYLLYEPKAGFRWLVRSDDNWSFVYTVPPGSVQQPNRMSAVFDGKQFKLYQDSMARVEYVGGEFYWKVTVGELVHAVDYVNPPYTLSEEVSATEASAAQASQRHAAASPADRRKAYFQNKPMVSGEINWSLGTYVAFRDVEKAFGIGGLPTPNKVAPNQVFPHRKIYKYWGLMLLALFLIGIVINVIAPRQKVFQQSFQLQPLKDANGTQVIFTDPIDLRGGRNVKVMANSNVDNTWLYVDGDFIDESSGLVQTFSLPVEYYHGVDDDGSWSEGSQQADATLAALPSSKYTMRMEVQWEQWQSTPSLNVTVEQGVPRMSYLLLAMVLISIVPLIVMVMHLRFVQRRWEDSDYSPFRSSS